MKNIITSKLKQQHFRGQLFAAKENTRRFRPTGGLQPIQNIIDFPFLFLPNTPTVTPLLTECKVIKTNASFVHSSRVNIRFQSIIFDIDIKKDSFVLFKKNFLLSNVYFTFFSTVLGLLSLFFVFSNKSML